MSPRRRDDVASAQVSRVLGIVFGLVFGGIGVTVLAFLWGTPRGEFGAPPLFFRIFGSFTALAFVAFGGAMLYGSIAGVGLDKLSERSGSAGEPTGDRDDTVGETESVRYVCPQCGAPLAAGADVSPHGDARCTFCSCWFNVHGK